MLSRLDEHVVVPVLLAFQWGLTRADIAHLRDPGWDGQNTDPERLITLRATLSTAEAE